MNGLPKRFLLGTTAVIGVLALLPSRAAAAPGSFAELVSEAIVVIDVLTPILISLTVVFYMWGIIRSMVFSKRGKEGEGNKFSTQAFKRQSLMGILIIFVLVSVWGILRLAANTFLSGGVNVSPESFNEVCVGNSLECDNLNL